MSWVRGLLYVLVSQRVRNQLKPCTGPASHVTSQSIHDISPAGMAELFVDDVCTEVAVERLCARLSRRKMNQKTIRQLLIW